MSSSLPQGWEEKELSEIAFFQRGFDLTNSKVIEGSYPVVKSNGIDIYHNEFKVKAPGVTTGRSGTLGKVFFIEKNFWPHNTSLFVKDFFGNDEKFIYYFLKTTNLENYNGGSSVPTLNRNHVHSLKVCIPSDKNEQKRIADILSAFDDKIEINNQINKSLEEMASAIFKEWFENFNFPNSQGKAYKNDGGKMKASELGEIPIDWEVKILDDILELIIDHRGKTPKKLGGDWVKSGIKAISAKHIKNFELININDMNQVDKEMYHKWMKEKLKSKDILMTSEAPLGELYFLFNEKDYVLSQRVYGLRTNKNELISELLFYFLKSSLVMNDILSRATGSTVQGIKQTELRQVKIIVPPKNIQEKVVQVFEDMLNQKSNNIEQNQILKKQRDTLLPKLMSGEIKV